MFLWFVSMCMVDRAFIGSFYKDLGRFLSVVLIDAQHIIAKRMTSDHEVGGINWNGAHKSKNLLKL